MQYYALNVTYQFHKETQAVSERSNLHGYTHARQDFAKFGIVYGRVGSRLTVFIVYNCSVFDLCVLLGIFKFLV